MPSGLKSHVELEFRAGQLLGDLQKEGYTPKDTVVMLVLLVAYMAKRQSKDVRQARNLFVEALDAQLNQVS